MTTSLSRNTDHRTEQKVRLPTLRWVSLTCLESDPDLVGHGTNERLTDVTWSAEVMAAIQLIHPIIARPVLDGEKERLMVVGNLALHRWLRHQAELDGMPDRSVLVMELAVDAPSTKIINAAERLIAPYVLGRSSTRHARSIRRQLKAMNDPALVPKQPLAQQKLRPVLKRKT